MHRPDNVVELRSFNEWVVTYRVESDSGWNITEFFRGSEQECCRSRDAFAGGESDTVRTNPWSIVIGPASDWDDFLADETAV